MPAIVNIRKISGNIRIETKIKATKDWFRLVVVRHDFLGRERERERGVRARSESVNHTSSTICKNSVNGSDFAP